MAPGEERVPQVEGRADVIKGNCRKSKFQSLMAMPRMTYTLYHR